MTVDKLQTRSKNKRLNKKRNKKSEWKKAVVEIRVQDQTTVEEAKMMQPNSISGTEEQRQQPGHARKQELLLRSRSKVRKLKRRQKKKNYGLLLRINKHAPITPPASFLYKRKKEISHFTKRSLKCL